MPSCENPCPGGSAHYCLSPSPCHHLHVTLTAAQWKDTALFISASSDEKIKTFSSQQLSGSNPGEIKAGLLNPRSHITSQAVFSIAHLWVFVSMIQFVARGQPFQQEHQEPLESIWVSILCAQHQAPTAATPGIRQTTWRVVFLSSALGFHLLTSVCTGFM